MKKIAVILKSALQSRNMCIHELAKRSGVSKSSVYRVLSDECSPSWDMALNLIQGLGGTVSVVFPDSIEVDSRNPQTSQRTDIAES